MSKTAAVRGLGLLELLTVLLLLAITLTLGSPLLRDLLLENRLQVETRRLLGALALARSEAVRSNTVVSVCPSSMARTGEPACTGSYADGWIVFLNAGADRVVQAETDRVLRVYPGLPGGYRVTNRRGTRLADALINYRPDGSARQNLTLQVCPPETAAGARLSIVLTMVGRARLDRDWGACGPLA
jgi:type IV fimbrial biogenesis protein FimT